MGGERKRGARNISEIYPGVDVKRAAKLAADPNFNAKRALIKLSALLSATEQSGVVDVDRVKELFDAFYISGYEALAKEINGVWTRREQYAARALADGVATNEPSTRP